MKLRLIIMLVLAGLSSFNLSCAGRVSDENSSEISADENNESEDDLDLESESGDETADVAAEDQNSNQEESTDSSSVADSSESSADEFNLEDEIVAQNSPQEVAPPVNVQSDNVESELVAPSPAPIEESTSVADSSIVAPAKPISLMGLKFKANDNGGTVIIEANAPINFKTRSNPSLQQFIIEIENAQVPEKLKRELNTKDMNGAIGSVDVYQNPGSSTAKVVIQMRDGFANPMVQQEGNSLLVVSSSNTVAMHSDNSSPEAFKDNSDKILNSQNLSEFLEGNTQFYGKKISIEMNEDMEIKDALQFLTEESGLNMIVSEDVKGKVRLKLRQVPWDQALVVLMRAKKLGYTRQGNVLRIAPIAELKTEEEEATKLAAARRVVEPLKVKMYPVNYAKVEDLSTKIKEFLTERGKVVGDSRTNALVVTDTEESLSRVGKLISSLDIQPPQVLIEGKIVEARETFSRSIGINWGLSGINSKLGATQGLPTNLASNLNVNSGVGTGGNLGIDLSIGTLGSFGNLTAALALAEDESKVKILSSPRIVSLTNETARISQTIQVPVRTATVNNGVQQISYSYKDLALRFEVTPQVSSDGGVIMKVKVNREFKGGSRIEQGIETFDVNSREADTRVLVKNGQTAVIGGVYQSDATTGNKKVPWFGDIPLLGWLFKTDTINREKNELLIFLTPRILANVENAATNVTEQEF